MTSRNVYAEFEENRTTHDRVTNKVFRQTDEMPNVGAKTRPRVSF